MNHFLNGWKGSKEGCEWREDVPRDVPSGFPPIVPSELVTSGCGKLIEEALWNWSFSLKWNIRIGLGLGSLEFGKIWVGKKFTFNWIKWVFDQKEIFLCRNIFWFSEIDFHFFDKMNVTFRVCIIYLWRFIWVLRFELEVNRFLQRLHSHGFSPVWTSSCFCKCASWVKDFVHFVHLKGRSPVCTRLWT